MMDQENMPKYKIVMQELQRRIGSGKLQADDRLPTEHELASRFEVSRQTVRQALGELVHEGILYRIQGSGTYVAKDSHSVPASQTAQAAGGRPVIGVLTTYISDYIFPHIVRGAESTLRSNGYQLMLSSTDNDKAKEWESLEQLMHQSLGGLIIEPTKSGEGNPNLDYFLTLDYRKIPYIMLNERYPDLDCPCIKVDDEQGGYLAARHLFELGHRFIAGFFKIDDLQGVNRLKGFVRAHREFQIPLTPDHVIRYTTENRETLPQQKAGEMLRERFDPGTESSTDSGPQWTGSDGRLAEVKPTAFVCYNDELAVRLLDVVRKAGISVPQQLSIIGFDDSFLATATDVKLTTLTHPKTAMGQQAASLLLDMIEGRADRESIGTVVHAPELVIRSSTSPLMQ